MLILKPLSNDWSVAGAKIPAVTFIAHTGFAHPWTCTHVRLLGPCFKTGRMEPCGRRTVHARTRANTFTHPEKGYRVPAVFPMRELLVTDKAKSTTRVLI